MPRSASRRSLPSIARAIFALSALTLGPIVASSCLTPDIKFGEDPIDSFPGGYTGETTYPTHCGNGELDGDESTTDCGGSCKGCDIGQICNVARDCEGPPIEDPAFVICDKESRCALSCPPGKSDCNSRGVDGCEIDILTSLLHCGECNEKCDLAHAADQCMSGNCLIKTEEANQGCDLNYANCNLDDRDGCEVNLLTDPKHCGACEGAACSDEKGAASCKAGTCAIECEDDYENCDKDAAANGCEIHTAANVDHCGSCGKICETNGDDWSAFCVEGDCGQTQCPTGLGDCDGDGECEDDLNTAEHCGRCGASCLVTHGAGECASDEEEAAVCAIASCESADDAEWADCDGVYANGCEVDTLSTAARCGGCLPAEGGEGQDCSSLEGSAHVTVTSCSGGGCAIVGCDSGWVDCDGDFATGCETNTTSDEDNCGGCADSADAPGEVCADKPHVAEQCTSGSCDYTCDSGWSDLNNDRYNTGGNGCETRTLATVGPSVVGSLDTGGNGDPLLISHTLQKAKGTQRLILVGVLCRSSVEADCALTAAKYGSTTLTLLDEIFSGNSSAKIYFALDKDLPDPGTYTVSLTRNNQWGSLAAEVREFSGAEQTTFYAAKAKVVETHNCNDSTTGPAVSLSGLPAGSVVYAFGGGAGTTSGGSATAIAPLVLSANRHEVSIVYGSGLTPPISGSMTASLDFSACYQSAMVAVGIRPEGNY